MAAWRVLLPPVVKMNGALVLHPLEGRRMAQGVASFCREKNGAAGVTSFQWERNGDVAGVASFLLERGRGRMAGSMSGLPGDAFGRGGEGSEVWQAG